MTGRTRPALPLWVWAASGTLGAGVLVNGGFGAGLALTGRLDASSAAWCFGLGSAAVAVVTVGAGVGAHRMAAALHLLRDDALHRLRDPDAPPQPAAQRGVRSTAELSELSSAVDALALRMRVADELAVRHRHNAETASAGMFELLSGLIAAEEAARGQFAAELHDTVAQSLAVARSLLADGEPFRAVEYVEEAEEQVRAAMARARPPALRDGDLASAVGLLRDDLERRYALIASLRWPPSPRPLPLATAVTIYRFFQEALLNVVKHADTDAASATLEIDGDLLIATVRDHGAGFQPDQVRPNRGRHVGLDLLRERVRLAGGSVDVRSRPGEGTTLELRLPIGGQPPPGPVAPGQTAGTAGSFAPLTRAGVEVPEPRVRAIRS